MGRKFSETDQKIFDKLAPELSGDTMSASGHNYPFILRPISHKVAESGEDFKNRLEKLDTDELDYLVQLAMEGKEDIRSLEEEDIDSFMEIVEEKLSTEKMKELKAKLGLV
ncbi:hypothetical protein HWN40_11765 [Methanolobus zinderi]|jgi:hypothetical protein|uniref:Uncharacterized protein n=1 Tax=Methanolobus zinderi TaxID=536044 RepID=A0A7D5EA03_9EURY|nr:hypothetical protein [Methanolobus zinderi]KXS44747.1 MAG: hypothetical protein AWU59_292 [Methanolobus sp. T82-4]QLC50857.1 hypothetical protein HWN40_11765 [Methanolobus zinderi]